MTGAAETVHAAGLPPEDAIAFFRQKANVTSEHWTDVWQEAHSQSFMVAGAATQALVEDFRREVAKAIEQGKTLADFRKEFDAIVEKHGWEYNGTPGWRSRIIYETNLSTAYSAGRYRQMTEPDTLAMYPYWQYVHNYAVHPRIVHVDWDGLTLRADDGWWSTHYPPNGWRCHCGIRILSERGLRRAGKTGPDTAPPLDLQPWKNPKTGKIEQVPRGIDPGFAYNPGKAWKDGAAAPGQPGHGGPTGRGGRLARIPPAENVTPRKAGPVKPDRPQADEDFLDWIDQQTASNRVDGSARKVGRLAPDVVRKLSADGDTPESGDIMLTSAGLAHLNRDTKKAGGRAIRGTDIRRLPTILHKPDAVYHDKVNGSYVLTFQPHETDPQGRIGKVVIRAGHNVRVNTGGNRERFTGNIIATAGLVPKRSLDDKAQFERLDEAATQQETEDDEE